MKEDFFSYFWSAKYFFFCLKQEFILFTNIKWFLKADGTLHIPDKQLWLQPSSQTSVGPIAYCHVYNLSQSVNIFNLFYLNYKTFWKFFKVWKWR